MTCSGCGGNILPGTKFICVWKTPDGFRMAVGCEHYTPEGTPDYTFGGSHCWRVWLAEFELSLRTCLHLQVH